MAAEGPRILYATRADGLGTRLKALAWAWRLAERLDALCVFAWPPTPGPLRPALGRAMPAWSLFDLRELCFQDRPRLRFIDGRLEAKPDWPWLDLQRQQLDPATLFADGRVLCHKGYQPLLLPDERRAVAAKEAGALLRSLTLATPVRSALWRTRADMKGRPYVAMHFRRGDIIVGLVEIARALEAGEDAGARLDQYLAFYAHKSTPLAAFEASVAAEIAAGRRVYLASDDAPTLAAMRARYADHLVRAADEGLAPIEAAMLDIVLQAGAERILASASGFPSAASLYGDVPITPLPIAGGEAAFVRDLEEMLGAAGIGRAVIDLMVQRLRVQPLLARRLER